jgi:ATP-dependent DNA ligase
MTRSILIPELPRFVPPMLAKSGDPFDSPEHLFEVKWDGTRVLAFVESRGYRLVNRHRVDVTDRYPELGFLHDLPAGVVLDGEVVVLRQGKPDFGLLLSRNQALPTSSLTCFTTDSSRCWRCPWSRAGNGWRS